MRTSLSDDNTFYQRAATHARLAFLAVNTHMIVVLACLTPQVPIIVKGCPSMLDTQGEYSDNSFM
jgi:hypothetical protein